MQNINEVQENPVEDARDMFIRAQDLRDITLTPEQLFEIQKNNLCETIMESMVKVATKNGAHVYASNILESMDDRLRTEIVDHFKSLDYDVILSEKMSTKQQTQQGVKEIEYRVISIGWAPKADEATDSQDQSPEAE
jgi:hypothetical protein